MSCKAPENALVLPEKDQIISCQLCLDSVPVSETDNIETEEYVAYFCGLDCYDIWKHQKSNKDAA